uniref:CD300A molecule n=1 Tax=Nannospalax galili TaxID=1026970 RepID=A0A8C6R8G9_NANGA
MTPGAPAPWLPSLLLLLWLPGCAPLSGPGTVTGIVGRSLSVQCQYEEKYKTYNKYWCRKSLLLCSTIVKTKSSGEVRKDRVSIRDHPANLTFTVTLEHLTLNDADTYECGIDTPWTEGFDKSVEVMVFIVPEPTSGPPVLPTSLATESSTQGSNSTEDHHEHQGLSLPVLLSVLALLLLLLVTSLLAWRMFQKWEKAVEHPEQSQNLKQATEHSEPQYVNLQLHTLSLREEPVPSSQVEVEYSTVAFPREELHYSSLVFDSQTQNSDANRVFPQTPQGQEPEYSVVRKPTGSRSESHP